MSKELYKNYLEGLKEAQKDFNSAKEKQKQEIIKRDNIMREIQKKNRPKL